MCLSVAGSAWAKGGGDKPIVDAAHYADESSVWIQLMQGDNDYWVTAGADIGGTEKGDHVRLDVRQGSKVLVSLECGFGSSASPGLEGVKCGEAADKHIKASGPLEANLILHADKDDKEYLLRTFKVNAKKWDNQVWQIDPDDLLGTAYIARNKGDYTETPLFLFWMANSAGWNAMLRCTVDGKAVDDIQGNVEDRQNLAVDIIKGPKRTTWHWTQAKFVPDTNQLTVAPDPKNKGRWGVYLSEHPGTWDCFLRKNGVNVREFRFAVEAKGMVAQHPMQQGKGAVTLAPSVSQIDVRIMKDNGVDQRIKPDQLKKSRGFGMPWPQHDSVKEVLAALPGAYENQNPVAVKPKGKLVDGPTANPPRFVDESTAALWLSNTATGYSVIAHQFVGGVRGANTDRYRLEWKQGGKLIATGKCDWEAGLEEDRIAAFGTAHAASVSCTSDEKPLTVKGPMEGTLILSDDSDGNEYVLRTYKVNVVKFTSFGDPVFQVVPDDVLATAWMYGNHEGSAHIGFRFWIGDDKVNGLVARCTVDGKKIPDFEFGSGGSEPGIVAEPHPKNGASKRYMWQHNGGRSETVAPGLPPKDYKRSDEQLGYLGEHPGSWDCDIRSGVKVVRKFMFKVNNKGYVEPDPALAGTPMLPDVVPIDMRFGKDIVDVRVRPDAMKKSRGFGLPWPKPPTKPFPAASGLPDPK